MHTEKEIIEKLKLIKFQIDGAISLIEAGCVRPCPKYECREMPNRIDVGDFTIMDRLIEPTCK